MMTLIFETEHAKLRLRVDGPLSQDEWDALSAQLSQWEPAVVSEGAQTVTRLLSELEEPPAQEWTTAPVEGKPFRHTWEGPLTREQAGMILQADEQFIVSYPAPRGYTRGHTLSDHTWVRIEPQAGIPSELYECGYGECNAHAEVRPQ